LSIAGHELKTPLTSVLLNLRMLDKALQGGARADDPRFAARWRAFGQQIGRLEGLVDQLLDVSRITAGKLELAPQRIDLAEIVREVVARFSQSPMAEARIRVQVAGVIEGSWDRLRLEQILTNLLSNAVKYGAGRPISVEARTNGARDDVWLVVSDEGIGMSSDDLGRIFGRFERAVSGRNYGGLGLGLWIVRQVVDSPGSGKTSPSP
jgi:signal transduction histidine kinase